MPGIGSWEDFLWKCWLGGFLEGGGFYYTALQQRFVLDGEDGFEVMR